MAFDPAVDVSANFGYQDDFQTTLSAAITSTTQLTISLTDLPTPTESTLVIEPDTDNEEEIFYNSQGSGVVNVPSASSGRGVNGTAREHANGSVVKMLPSKAQMDALKYGRGFATANANQGISTSAIRQEAWTDFTPSPSGFSGSPTVNYARYRRIGNLVYVKISVTGTSNSASTSFTLPVAAETTQNLPACLRVVDNGTVSNNPGLADLTAGSTTCNIYRDHTGNTWTTSGTKTFEGTLIYEADAA